jgi:tetratricopeptide (TPR) repeat protein
MKLSNADEAIRLAMQGRWEEAVEINNSIIAIAQEDIDAHNRLGKALAELGRYDEAKKSYERTLELDQTNIIARRNIQRLSHLKNEERPPKDPPNIDSKFFIEETGKARIISLCRTAPRETLAKMSAGDRVYLQVKEQRLVIINESGDYLGEVEPKVASRPIELMEGGNEYQAAIISLRDNRARVIIRETFQHPSQIGHPSFTPRIVEELKPYLKSVLVKHDTEDDLPLEPEEPGDLEGEVEPTSEDDIQHEDEAPALAEEDVDAII